MMRLLRALLRAVAPGWRPTRHRALEWVLYRWTDLWRRETLETRHGFRLQIPKRHRSPLVPRLVIDGEYEPAESRVVRSLLQPGDLAFDVGANIGYMTCLMAGAVGAVGAGAAGRVHAFEPEPRNYEILCANLRLNGYGCVEPRRLALSNRQGSAPLLLSTRNHADHTLVEVAGRDAAEVPVTTFDAYHAAHCAGRTVSLVKIDVQGHELEVLEGMRGALAGGWVQAVLLELWPARCPRPQALLRALAEMPFRPAIVDGSGGDALPDLAAIEASLPALRRDPGRAFSVLLRREGDGRAA